jgi:hypothetical protein
VDEKETLELDVSIDEIKNVLKILKPNKSPGEDGIISEFYITHWEQIKDEFFLLVTGPNVFILVKQLLIFLQECLQLFCSHCLIESVISSFVYLPAPHFYVIE